MWEMGFVCDPQLCRGPSQGFYGSRIIGLVCTGDTVGKMGRGGWNGWERTCACGQCQVRQGMRHDTWMTFVFGTQRCAILCFAALEPRVFAWWNVITLCNFVGAVFCGCAIHTLPSVGWRFLSRQPKPVLTLRKIINRQAWRMLRIPSARRPLGLVPRWRRWRSCWQVGFAILTKLSAGFATLCRTSKLF